jgi:hypothetical protein
LADISVGAIGAAAIGGVASLLTLVISKESKTSEFRQTWIDAFRNDVAEAIGSLTLLLPLFSERDGTSDGKELHEPLLRASSALARVELRLNLLEEDHQDLQNLIHEAEQAFHDAENGAYDSDAANDMSRRIVDKTQMILKSEWDRVRNGEPAFQMAKAGAVLLVVSAALYAMVAVSG